MKFRVLVNELTLKKEGIKKVKGDVFEVNDDRRAQEILNYKFNGKPVVEPFFYDKKTLEMETRIKELEEMNASLQEENKNLEARLEETNNLLVSNSNENTEEHHETENNTANDEEKDEEKENVHEKSKSKK
mgnify:CR=1 FL=1